MSCRVKLLSALDCRMQQKHLDLNMWEDSNSWNCQRKRSEWFQILHRVDESVYFVDGLLMRGTLIKVEWSSRWCEGICEEWMFTERSEKYWVQDCASFHFVMHFAKQRYRLNGMGKGYLRSVCGKTSRDEAKNKVWWMEVDRI